MGLKSEGRSGNGLPQHANITKQDQAGPLLELAKKKKSKEGGRKTTGKGQLNKICDRQPGPKWNELALYMPKTTMSGGTLSVPYTVCSTEEQGDRERQATDHIKPF